MSAAMERDRTMPPAPPMPCKNRAAIKTLIEMDRQHISDAPTKINNVNSNIGRRPYLSLAGPNSSCPIASPTMQNVSPNCTTDVSQWKTSAISGNAGKYMSMTNAPNAESRPRNTIKYKKYFLQGFFIIPIILSAPEFDSVIAEQAADMKQVCSAEYVAAIRGGVSISRDTFPNRRRTRAG